MTKSELIERLAKRESLSPRLSDIIVNIFWEKIVDGLANGDRAGIRVFASFKLKEYPGYQGRNPKTGALVKVKPKKLPVFKPGKELKRRVDSTPTAK
jgi:integration host factor subunit beta